MCSKSNLSACINLLINSLIELLQGIDANVLLNSPQGAVALAVLAEAIAEGHITISKTINTFHAQGHELISR